MTKKKESINNEEVIELGEKEKLTEGLFQKQDMPMRLHCILKFKMEIL